MTELTQTQVDILALANELADIDDDMSVAQAGGGRRLLEEGFYIGRFTQYTEWGKHVQVIQGKAKEPAQLMKLGFELFSTQGKWVNPDMSPVLLETFDMSKSRNEKANSFKMFKSMNFTGTAKNFAQLLNTVYIIKVVNKGSAAKPDDLRSRIDQVTPGIDMATGQAYPCPPAQDLLLFSWVKPTLAAWDKLFIDGVDDKGNSKNYKQSRIVGALDFPGSPLEQLLMANQRPIPAATPQPTGAGQAPAGAAPMGAVPPAAAPVAAPVTAAAPAAVPTPSVQAGVPVAAPVVAPAAVAVAAPAVSAAPLAVAPVVAPPVVTG